MKRISVVPVSLLLAGSGFAALVYQIVWLRSLRLVFGASTTASAAVLAIFMGGLGFGALVLGKRADRVRNPLRMYAHLELGIAATAALSPLLIGVAHALYVATGGTATLGMAGGTAARLLLSTVVLGVPTFLMGGTLPAAARAVERATDTGRRDLGVLYAVNTLGAVTGAVWASFASLEIFGARKTLWIAALLNALVAMTARRLSRGLDEDPEPAAAAPEAPRHRSAAAAPPPFVYAAAGLVGFAFLGMELVWYRMLAPILGGSSYTFGLILAVALLGIGAGGFVYGLGARDRRVSLAAFAGTCALEAACFLVPFALGDHLALLAAVLRPMGAAGFGALVGAWSIVAVIVILPGAVVAGYQFPMLVALLGEGRKDLGRQVGMTYAWNTVGSIVGSLAVGFVVLPWLGAVDAWRSFGALLGALALVSTALGLRQGIGLGRLVAPVACAVAALTLAGAVGPTAAWRHSPIGAGRFDVSFSNPNEMRRAFSFQRQAVAWEADGVESSVALKDTDGYAFVIHGKTDGNARSDAPTQVMAGMVGAALHPAPRSALVIGLGTGSTAGWLGAVPGMGRVDAVELEPVITHVAHLCAPVNEAALDQDNLHLHYGDAREFLLTTDRRYDLIFSEPSNPYRAGIASLFTKEIYETVSESLEEGGIFMQWLQAYEVDAQTVRTVFATLATVFPYVETWQLRHESDLLLLASRRPIEHDAARMQQVLAGEPWRRAMASAWGVTGVEGFYANFYADSAFAHAIREAEGERINTDDLPLVEFGFARSVGRKGLFDPVQLKQLALRRGEGTPPLEGGALSPGRLEERYAARALWDGERLMPTRSRDPALRARMEARRAWSAGKLAETHVAWSSQPGAPEVPADLALVAESFAHAGDARAGAIIAILAETQPVMAAAARARLLHAHGDLEGATTAMIVALDGYRSHPWAHTAMMERALNLAATLALSSPERGRRIYDALGEPFCVHVLDARRVQTRYNLASRLDFDALCVEALVPLEPNPPWELSSLASRHACYRKHGHPLEAKARADLERFLADEPTKLDAGLR